jgi:hypothetical protein
MNLIQLTELFEKFSTYKNAEEWILKFKPLISKLHGTYYLYYSPEHYCLNIEYLFINFTVSIEIYQDHTIIAKYHKGSGNLLEEDLYNECETLNIDLINEINLLIDEVSIYEQELYEN